MVDGMSVAHAPEVRHAEQERDREAAVHEPVVDEDVRDAERRHSCARSDRERGRDSVQIASEHHEARGDRRVRGGERVVGFEAPAPAPVMGAMHVPQCMVPHASVEEARPRLHEGRHDHGEQHAGGDERERAHEVTS
jgi:hypothetical protein